VTDGRDPTADDDTENLSRRRDLYVDLLRGCLTRELFLTAEAHDIDLSEWPGDADELRSILGANKWHLGSLPQGKVSQTSPIREVSGLTL